MTLRDISHYNILTKKSQSDLYSLQSLDTKISTGATN